MAKLIEEGAQSQTVKSYVSAIKSTLVNDDYAWDDSKLLLNSLTRASKLVNDQVKIRLPIQYGLLELILFELQRNFGDKQVYLEKMYKAVMMLGYYGLMRVGELVDTGIAQHTLKAENVHMAVNKDKLMLVLYSSKTHGRGNLPQKIKITSNNQANNWVDKHFCPFKILNDYIAVRGTECSTEEQFFIFRDKSKVTAQHVRCVLKSALRALNLNDTLYGMHSLRIGRASHMLKFQYSIEEIKRAGRWKSNAVFRYLRD